MSYKITKANEATTYEAPNHFDVRTTRLHNPADVNDGKIVMGLSHFLPGGGLKKNSGPMEFIYYVVSGEMTITTDDGKKHVLHAGDSIHAGVDTPKEALNTGITAAQMLVVIIPPAPAK